MDSSTCGGAAVLDELRQYSLFRNLRPASEYRLRRALALYSDWLGREARTGDLTDESVSLWIKSLEQTHSPKSVYGFRTDLLCLWRDCAARGLCAPPSRVRRVKKPQPLPRAWTIVELRRLLDVVRQLDGSFHNGVSRRLYSEALVLACYDTGLRRSDLWQIRRGQVREDGSVLLRQQKTGHTHFPRMRPPTLQCFLMLPGDRPLACPYRSASAFYKWWKSVTTRAGVSHGAMQQLRRTGATHLAIEHRDAVQTYLGHRTSDMMRHYIDESIARPQDHWPPSLGDQLSA